MTKKSVFLIVQSILRILIAVILAAGIIRIYLEGSAWQAAGHPADWIFTREKVAAVVAPVIPLFLVSLAMTVYGLATGIKDEDAGKPCKDIVLAPDFNKAGPERLQKRARIRKVLMVVAVCLVVLGIFNGSMRDVLVKAIKICTECVGLG